MSMPGPFELLIIFFVILLLFGGKRLPEFGKALGQGIKEFKKAIRSVSDDGDSKSNSSEK